MTQNTQILLMKILLLLVVITGKFGLNKTINLTAHREAETAKAHRG